MFTWDIVRFCFEKKSFAESLLEKKYYFRKQTMKTDQNNQSLECLISWISMISLESTEEHFI